MSTRALSKAISKGARPAAKPCTTHCRAGMSAKLATATDSKCSGKHADKEAQKEVELRRRSRNHVASGSASLPPQLVSGPSSLVVGCSVTGGGALPALAPTNACLRATSSGHSWHQQAVGIHSSPDPLCITVDLSLDIQPAPGSP